MLFSKGNIWEKCDFEFIFLLIVYFIIIILIIYVFYFELGNHLLNISSEIGWENTTIVFFFIEC